MSGIGKMYMRYEMGQACPKQVSKLLGDNPRMSMKERRRAANTSLLNRGVEGMATPSLSDISKALPRWEPEARHPIVPQQLNKTSARKRVSAYECGCTAAMWSGFASILCRDCVSLR